MGNAFQLKVDNEGIATVTFDQPGGKVNILSMPAMEELDQLLNELSNRADIKALVFQSGKPGIFVAGADLEAFEPAFKKPVLCENLIRRGHETLNKLAALPFPTIAVIDGGCFGGGTELSLAFTYRVVTDSDKTQISLPEVTLGLMPGWGGTQRLPRLVGLEQSLGMILSGSPIDGKKAFKIGYADAIFPSAFLNEKIKGFIGKCTTQKGKEDLLSRRKKTGVRHWLMEKNPLGRALLFFFAKKNVLAKTKGQYPAPLYALDVIRKSHSLPLKDGLEYEIKAFIKAIPKEFKHTVNLIRLFFANEALKKNPGLTGDAKPREVKKGAVIGAGTMGAGIAWLFSYRGIPVRMKDISWEAVAKGYGAARDIYKKLVKIRKLKPFEVDKMFLKLEGTVDYSGFRSADFVIEAATENLELKRKIFSEIENVVKEDAIIASNTSSLPISEMSKQMKHPERFLGMHFFNPPNRMPLVEIVAGEKTSPEALATAVELCKRFKKVPIVVKDCPGFLVNRIFMMAANEAAWMLQEGVEMERLDRLMRKFGMPMGPFVLADEVGNDVAYKVTQTFFDAYGDRMKIPEITKAVYDAGLYGKKIGKGFYLYNGEKRKENPQIHELLQKIKTEKRQISDEDVVDRLTLSMANEASRCLEEGVVKDPMYVDMALIYGTGFPPFRAGLLHYVDSLGVKNVVSKLEAFSKVYGERFKPSNRLRQMAEEGRSFYSESSKPAAVDLKEKQKDLHPVG